jgi:hypothetical protein
MKAAIIVAHPDDEIIWSGGLILQHPEWQWTVLSLSRADDPDRRPKFERVCSLLNIHGFISDLDDGNPLRPISPRREIGRRIIEHLTSVVWNLCITHGANGEYGHLRHRETHNEVISLIEDGILDCDELWTFAYVCDSAAPSCRPEPDAEILTDLTVEELLEKKRIVCEEYGYAEDSFEANVCISPEAFRRLERTEEAE